MTHICRWCRLFQFSVKARITLPARLCRLSVFACWITDSIRSTPCASSSSIDLANPIPNSPIDPRICISLPWTWSITSESGLCCCVCEGESVMDWAVLAELIGAFSPNELGWLCPLDWSESAAWDGSDWPSWLGGSGHIHAVIRMGMISKNSASFWIKRFSSRR